MDSSPKQPSAAGNKGRSCGYKGGSSRKSKDRFYNSEDFMVNCFKVLPCFKKYRHDWWVCPYAHEGETAKRRDPKKFKYVGVACPDAKQGKACPRGDDCPCTHNVFEYWLHPTRFRTAFCGRGIHCTRPFCFFAHSLNEMRKPSLDDLLVVIQGDSLFNGDMLKRALEEHKKDVERLGGKDTDTDLLDMSFLQTPQGMDLMKEVSVLGPTPSSPSPRELLQSAHSPSPRGHRGPMPRSAHHSPIRSTSPYRSHNTHEPYHNPMSDSYMPSPRDLRDLSPGHDMSKGRPRVNVPATTDMLPDMQSPREVLGFMNTVLMNASPRDLSPENLRFVQTLRDEAAALMTGTPSPRDLSPQARHSAMDVYNYQSPRGMSPPIHHASPHTMRTAGSHRDVSPGHGVDGSLLDAMNAFGDMKTDDDHMSPMYRASGHHRNSFHGSSLSPRQASWHNGEMAELMTNAVQMEREHIPRGRTAGAYDGGKAQNDVREMLAEMQRSHSGSGQGLAAQFVKNHTTMPLPSGSLNAYRDNMHSAVSQDVQEAIIRESMRASFDESANYRDIRRVPSESLHASQIPPVGDDSSVFPQSLQAVLRSLSKEEHGYNQEEEASSASRPFSSLSGLW